MRRVYYSAFSPIPDAHAKLPVRKAPLEREHRLYQADWLMRFYGFKTDEIAPLDRPTLRLDVDPKTAWALENREFFPVDVNKASKEALLRVPGLGLRTVEKLLLQRKHRAIRWSDLKKMRCPSERVRLFVVTADTTPTRWSELSNSVLPQGEQLELAF